MLTENEYDYLARGLAIGVGIGVIVGIIMNNVVLLFAAGGVIGVISSLIYSSYKTFKNKINYNKDK